VAHIDALTAENERLQREIGDPKKILEKLRWRADMKVWNHEGEYVWLKPHMNEAGKRIGITDCCLVSAPCKRHADV